MLGYDISWAAFNIIEVMSASKFTFKVSKLGLPNFSFGSVLTCFLQGCQRLTCALTLPAFNGAVIFRLPGLVKACLLGTRFYSNPCTKQIWILQPVQNGTYPNHLVWVLLVCRHLRPRHLDSPTALGSEILPGFPCMLLSVIS